LLCSHLILGLEWSSTSWGDGSWLVVSVLWTPPG
jgi:hypothetical protein